MRHRKESNRDMRVMPTTGLSILLLSLFISTSARSEPTKPDATPLTPETQSQTDATQNDDTNSYPAGLIALSEHSLFSSHSFVIEISKRMLYV